MAGARPTRRIDMTEQTVRRFIDAGDLPGYRMGRAIRIKEADLAAFIESCRIVLGTMLNDTSPAGLVVP